MNPFSRMPGPGPRGERGGTQMFHVMAMFFGVALVLLAVVVVVLLLWTSFRVRAEVRALRGEVARLGSGGRVVGAATAVPGVAVAPASAAVNRSEEHTSELQSRQYLV